MVSALDVDADKLIRKTAQELKKEIKQPDWSFFVKTGAHKERRPEDPNWWFLRAASIMRKIYKDGPVGVQKLRSVYGGRKNLGHRPNHSRKAGGKIIRTVLNDLEKLGYVEKVKKPKKGRMITPKGQKFLDNLAKGIARGV